MKHRRAWVALATLALLGAWRIFRPDPAESSDWLSGASVDLLTVGWVALLCMATGAARTPQLERLWRRFHGSTALAVLTALAIAGVAYLTLGGPSAWPDLVHTGDWGVNEAFIHAFVEAYARGRPLLTATEISAGEPIADLYPTLVHRTLAWLIHLTQRPDLVQTAMGGTIVLAVTTTAIGVSETARRLGAAWPAAWMVGCAVVLDAGSDYSWGARAIFFWGFFPSTCAIACMFATLPALLDIQRVRQPWWPILGVGLSALIHPVGLVLVGALSMGAVYVWLMGKGRSTHVGLSILRAAAAGLFLSSWVWVPMSARVVAYGLHYGTPNAPISLVLQRMVAGEVPDGSFALLVALGWWGAALALVDRGSDPRRTVIAVAALVLIGLYIETLFLDLGLAPSLTSVRWQSYRVGTLIKPLIMVLAAVVVGGVPALYDAFARSRRWQLVALALVTILLLVGWQNPTLRAALETNAALVSTRSAEVHRAQADQAELDRMLDVIVAEAGGNQSRVLLNCPTECRYYAIQRLRQRGQSVLVSHAAPAGFFLREQFFTTTPENLRRFGVRWIIGTTREPPPLTNTQPFGDFLLARNPTWDGELVHTDDAAARVRSTTLPGEGFMVDVEADHEVVVELGTPFYPRLVAVHEGSGGRVEVEGMLVDGPGSERAVRMSLPPGRTVVRADGQLPSDGRPPLILILALSVLALVAQRQERLQHWHSRAWDWLVQPKVRRIFGILTLLLPVVLVARAGWLGTANTLRFGVLFPRPRIEVVTADGPQPCVSESAGRAWRCPNGATLAMTTSHALHDRRVGWPIPAPAVTVQGETGTYRLSFPARLRGDYLGICSGCTAHVSSGAATSRFAGRTTRASFEGTSDAVLEFVGGSGATFTLVSSSLLDAPYE